MAEHQNEETAATQPNQTADERAEDGPDAASGAA
jgi:hypothetical protein